MPSTLSLRTLRHAGTLLVLGIVAAGPLLAQGWVGRGRLEGVVMDEAGEPIEGARVTLRKADAAEEAGPEPFLTDEKGRWSYLGLSHGEWRVVIEKEGLVPSEGVVNVNEFGRNPTISVTLREAPENVAAEQFEEANALFEARQWEDARNLYQEILPRIDEEDHPAVLDRIARTHLAEGHSELAIDSLERGLEIDPANRTLLELSTMAYLSAGQPEKAIETTTKALLSNPEDSGLRSLQAQAYYEAGQEEEAIGILMDVVEEDHADGAVDQPDVLQTLVELLMDSDREAEAEKYVALMPEGAKLNPETLLNTGIDAFNEGDIDKALHYFEQAVQENPDMADGYYYRGLAYLNHERNAEAKADFEKFVAMAPDHPKAAEAREFLKYLDAE